MRVLVVAEQLRRRVPGGIGTYALGLLQGLAEIAGGAQEVAGARWEADRAQEVGDVASAAGSAGPGLDITVHASVRLPGRPDRIEGSPFPVRSAWLPSPLLTRGWDAGLVRAPAGFDVVHSVSLAMPVPARRSSGRIRLDRRGSQSGRDGAHARTLCTVHDLAWRSVADAHGFRGGAWHEHALARALAEADAFVVPSEETAVALIGAGAPEEDVHVVAEGCDHLPDPDDAATESLLARLAVPGAFLFAVGTMEPRKNLARLFEAFSAVRRDLPGRPPLVVAGPKGWGLEVGVRPGVVLAGEVRPQVLSGLYRRALLLVYAPLVEGWGLPPTEAMAAGTPVVASPMPSTHGAAYEVDPYDSASIAEGIRSVVSDEDLRGRLVTAGAARAADLTWRAAALAHVELWRRYADEDPGSW